MKRVLGVLAALMWVVGMVLLVVALLSSEAVNPFPEICQFDDLECFGSPGGPNVGALVGTILVGVAGVLTGALVLGRRASPSTGGERWGRNASDPGVPTGRVGVSGRGLR